jgi:hypothetical protein
MACCLPTGALLAAVVGAAGATLQPWLLGFSALALIAGAVMARRARSCSPRRRAVNLAVLAVSAALVVPVLVAPARTAAFLADSVLPAGRAPEGQAPLGTLDVAALRDRFNRADHATRVIAMFSPT